MIVKDYAVRALAIMGVERPAGSTWEHALDALNSPDALTAFWSSLWMAPGGVLEHRFREVMASFVTSERDSVRRYLCNDLGFAEVTGRFVRNACSVDLPPAGTDVCMAELAMGRDAVYAQVTDVLAGCLRTAGRLGILGFGADDCSFEREIGAFVQASGFASGFQLYRWDPCAEPLVRVIDATPVQLRDPAFAMTVDIVTCRWALHHLSPSARWADLHSCLWRLRPGAHLIAVEEGDFADRNELALAHRLYRFLVMAVDVVTNAAIRPGWFTSNARRVGAGFHVDYLDASDLADIERGFRYPFSRTVHLIEAGRRFGQTVITWHVGH